MNEKPGVSRRRILRSVGASSITLGGIGISSDPVAADAHSPFQIERLSGYRAKYIAAVARYSREYRSLVTEFVLEDAAADLEAEVFARSTESGKTFIVSFTTTGRSLPSESELDDIAVALDSEYEVVDAKAVLRHRSPGDESNEFRVYSTNNGVVSVERPASSEEKSLQVGTASAGCSSCKAVYGVICDVGCNVGAATICYIVGGGWVGAWCGALAGDICEFVDENSCEAGLNEVVCQILGYCSTGPGEEPCEEFPGGVDSPHCDG